MYFICFYGQQVKIRNTKKKIKNEFSCKLLFQESIFSIKDSTFHLNRRNIAKKPSNYWKTIIDYCEDINKQYNYTINVGALWMTHFYVCLIHVGECAQLTYMLADSESIKNLNKRSPSKFVFVEDFYSILYIIRLRAI